MITLAVACNHAVGKNMEFGSHFLEDSGTPTVQTFTIIFEIALHVWYNVGFFFTPVVEKYIVNWLAKLKISYKT